MLTTDRAIAAPAASAWIVLTELDRWPEWGPSIRRAVLDDGGRVLSPGATGRVETAVGIGLPFRITEFVDGERWAWNVAGRSATEHVVTPLGPDRCRVAFGVPWWAPPYLAVCALALRRIERMVT